MAATKHPIEKEELLVISPFPSIVIKLMKEVKHCGQVWGSKNSAQG